LLAKAAFLIIVLVLLDIRIRPSPVTLQLTAGLFGLDVCKKFPGYCDHVSADTSKLLTPTHASVPTSVPTHTASSSHDVVIIETPKVIVVRYRVPVFFTMNVGDLPDIIQVLNNKGALGNPVFEFYIEKYDALYNKDIGAGPELGITLALCDTDRVDVNDTQLLDDLRSNKGFSNIIMVILRSGSNVAKFTEKYDVKINSGVGGEKALFQFIFNSKKKVLDEAVNHSNAERLLEMASRVFVPRL